MLTVRYYSPKSSSRIGSLGSMTLSLASTSVSVPSTALLRGVKMFVRPIELISLGVGIGFADFLLYADRFSSTFG